MANSFFLSTAESALTAQMLSHVIGKADGDTLTSQKAGKQQVKIRLAEI